MNASRAAAKGNSDRYDGGVLEHIPFKRRFTTNPLQKTCVFIPALLQGDPDSGRAVEETLQVKARELVRATAV